FNVAVRATDPSGASDVQRMLVTVTGTAPTADVGVTLDDGVDDVAPGGSVVYTMVITNHGTDAVPGEAIAMGASPQLVNVGWTCVASAGSTCTASSGTGAIGGTIDLAPGGTTTHTTRATGAARRTA